MAETKEELVARIEQLEKENEKLRNPHEAAAPYDFVAEDGRKFHVEEKVVRDQSNGTALHRVRKATLIEEPEPKGKKEK